MAPTTYSRGQQQISPAENQRPLPQRPVPCQPTSNLIDPSNDFSFIQQRYQNFNALAQPNFDHFNTGGSSCDQQTGGFNFTSTYYPQPPPCFQPSSVSPTQAAAAAYAASYSSTLLSMPPVTTASFWPNFNLYQNTSNQFNQLLSNKIEQPTTPSNSNSANISGSNSSGTRSSTGSSARLNGTGQASSTTPTLQTLSSRPTEAASSNGPVVKSSPPESGYCGSPSAEEWNPCSYPRQGGHSSTAANNGPFASH